jgi:hypothetical protein
MNDLLFVLEIVLIMAAIALVPNGSELRICRLRIEREREQDTSMRL